VPPPRRYAIARRSRALLRLYYFVFFSALGAYNPFFPTWLRARGIEGFAMSSIMVLNPLFGMVAPLAFGVAADTLGLRGSLLRIAAMGALLPFGAIVVLSLTGHGIPYWTLFSFMAVFAFFRGPLVSLADVTALEDPGSYGRTRLFGSAGFMAMAVLAGFVIDPASPAALPVAVALPLVLTAVVAARLPAKSARPPEPIAEDAVRLLRSPDYLLFLFGSLLWYASHVSYDLCFSLQLRDIGASSGAVGVFWAVGVIAEIALMSVAHRLFERFSPARLISFGLASAAARFALVASVHSLGVLFLLQPLHALTFALVWTASLEFVRKRAPSHVLATAQSLFSVSACLGSALGMLAWGPLYAKSGGTAVFAGASAVALLGSFVASALGARHRHPLPGTSTAE
jgi:PPP family 3-phenylpropionic acid transporter